MATGDDYLSLSILFRIAPSTISLIIKEVCQLIIDIFGPMYVRLPKTEREWRNVAARFGQSCNFKHSLGAIDCKHVRIQKPQGSGSIHFNRKKFFSIQLLVLVDSDYRIRYLDVGKEGSRADVTVWRECNLYKRLDSINLPANLINNLPFVFLADGGFELNDRMMTPYRQKSLTNNQRRSFNKRLCKARRIVEQVFGIMVNRFRILFKPMKCQPGTAKKITTTICILHNMLINRNRSTYLNDSENETDSSIYSSSDSEYEYNNRDNNLRDRFASYYFQ